MKKQLLQLFILLTFSILIQSCGAKDGGGNKTKETTEANSSQLKFSEKEKILGEKLSHCLEDYISNITEMVIPVSEEIQFLAIGMTGHECLNIKNVEALKLILSEYKNSSLRTKREWKFIARKILKRIQK